MEDGMENVQEIINALGPTDELHWDIALYILFFFNLIMLFLLPDGATLHTMLLILVLVSIFIDKTYAFGYFMNSGQYTAKTCHTEIFVGTYLIRAIMFIAPLMIAGSTDKDNVRALGILLGILSTGYLLGRWFLDQREVEAPDITCMATGAVAQNAGMIITLAYATLRRRVRAVFTLDAAGEWS
jgi:hypothetical protein